MKYQFPFIQTIEDVLPHIDDNFIVADRGNHVIINYVLAGNETFPNLENEKDFKSKIRRECRGLIFDKATGNIIRRPLHKFFNLNEREETNVKQIDWETKHYVLDKLDGSQIVPYKTSDGNIIWGTKMGDTDVAKQATDFVLQNPKYTNFANYCFEHGVTPIFEWVSQKQRIVIDYPQDQLVLLAVRHTKEGAYLDRIFVDILSAEYDIPIVKQWDVTLGKFGIDTFLSQFDKLEDIEGVVIQFEDGHMIKVKTEWYVRLHKTKDQISSEKNVVELIINNQLDDIMPFLLDGDKEKIEKYQNDFWRELGVKKHQITNFYKDVASKMPRKTFALNYNKEYHSMWKMIIFKLYDNPSLNLKVFLKELIMKHCTSNQQFAKLKEWLLKEITYE